MKMTLPWVFEFGSYYPTHGGELWHDPRAYDSGSCPEIGNTTDAYHVHMGEGDLGAGGDDLFLTGNSH